MGGAYAANLTARPPKPEPAPPHDRFARPDVVEPTIESLT
jgi:hypothetical protein